MRENLPKPLVPRTPRACTARVTPCLSPPSVIFLRTRFPHAGTHMPTRKTVLAVALAAATLGSAGCFLVAAGAGAGAAVAYNNRGATAQLPGGVNATFDKAVASFARNGISETGRGTENSGTLRTLTGTKGDLEVTVEMKRESDNVTAVEVVAKKNVVEYDRDFAKQVLEEMAK